MNAHIQASFPSKSASDFLLNTYPDASSVPEWARKAIAWRLGNGIISGINLNGTIYIDFEGMVDRVIMAQVMVNTIEGGAL
ncbi:MAG: hypothetical protein LUB61_06080 [Eggerthellaceae bacterium]|nr:hypothetical protein [Eggerthellaceae bacterium]